jgi:two-component system chemotaxis response regulator CheY
MKKILLIEDDPVARSVYQRFLQSHGFSVEVALNGDEGLDKLASVQPDAVVVDVMMPKLNGITVIEVMRVQEAFRSVPVVVLTNAAIPAFIEQARAAGAEHIFDKSHDSPLAVAALLHQLLDRAPRPKAVAAEKESRLYSAGYGTSAAR